MVQACRAARRSLLAPDSSLVIGPQRSALHQLTTAVAGTTDRSDLQAVLESAVAGLGVDAIGLSIISAPGLLRELSSTEPNVDGVDYAVDDFPATRHALDTGALVEAHVTDLDSDPAERRMLEDIGMASLLIVPLFAEERPLGILEFSHRVERRWGADELTLARLLADHVARAVARLGVVYFG